MSGFGSIIPPPTNALAFSVAINPSVGPFTSDSTLSGFTVVDKYLVGAITAFGTTIKVSVQAPPAAGGTLNNIYIGQVASSGNAYNFDGGQVAVTFSGSASLVMSAAVLYTSDEITFTIDGSKAILIAYNIGSTTTLIKNTSLGSNFIRYTKSGVQEAALTLKGASYSSSNGISFITSQVLVA